jgi:hypothetical protein
MAKQSKRDRERILAEMAEHATALLQFVGTLDPTWQTRIDAVRAERGFSDVQMVTAWIARTLENESHMTAPQHPFFTVEYQPSSGVCPACGTAFKPAFAGQTYCTDECWTQAQAPASADAQVSP